MRFRWEDTSTGRFLSQDPIRVPARNDYTYADQNPSSLIDPDGRDVYLWARQQRSPDGEIGHVSIEVDDPDTGGIFSIGAYPSGGLQSPDTAYGERTNLFNPNNDNFFMLQQYPTTDDEERRMIKFLKDHLQRAKTMQTDYWSPPLPSQAASVSFGQAR